MTTDLITDEATAAQRFSDWLESEVIYAARGDRYQSLPPDSAGPSSRFWLGRVASEDTVQQLGWDERGQRLDPCAIGLTFKPLSEGPWQLRVRACLKLWTCDEEKGWQKKDEVVVDENLTVLPEVAQADWLQTQFDEQFRAQSMPSGVAGLVRSTVFNQVDPVNNEATQRLSIELINSSEARSRANDTNFYQCRLYVQFHDYTYIYLEDIPGSFRYDRRVTCRGINCGCQQLDDDWFQTADTSDASTQRPTFETAPIQHLNFSFTNVAANPIQFGIDLASAMRQWGHEAWSTDALSQVAKVYDWTEELVDEAHREAEKFWEEVSRIESGTKFLSEDEDALRAFQLMNEAMRRNANGAYEAWRSFQVGFLYTLLPSLREDSADRDVVDIVWFATGGGKTETYLGAIIVGAFYDRLKGKKAGVTAWSRFPLRMLSMQQTQRFANAMAAAELVRQEAGIPGEPFTLGFFVGKGGGTPNRIREDEVDSPDPYDDEALRRYQILLSCPFCRGADVDVRLDTSIWLLQHECRNPECSYYKSDLNIRIVDEEIYRNLPTAIVGTLDKAALVGMQAAMAGLLGPPKGICSRPGHGYIYASRSSRPNGCLVPGCDASTHPLNQPARHFGISMRLQDELHLLKDSLGAVDAHYEAILDGIQYDRTGTKPKLLASSATLSGFQKQCEVLYRRESRVFPVQPPTRDKGFWVADRTERMRNYVGLAPRGVTIEYALDQLFILLQERLRSIYECPDELRSIGISPDLAGFLVSMYGVDVAYGNTIRDIAAVQRSLPTQVEPHLSHGQLRYAELTGTTDFDTVRSVLRELQNPPDDFYRRTHLITASSMMSHGVDIDRLNIMAMIGVPLTTSEFIQSTARVGRSYPGLVFVFHRMARERDAVIYRNFEHYVTNADRMIEPIPITNRSRRVLAKTLPGIFGSRVRLQKEIDSEQRLTTLDRIQALVETGQLSPESEVEDICRYLELKDDVDTFLIDDVRTIIGQIFDNIVHPPGNARFLDDVFPEDGPMTSLRDVEETVKVVTRRT